MRKRINLVTNHTNGAGLQKDGQLLFDLLTARGHEVAKVQFDSPRVIQEALSGAHLNIFMEIIVPGLMGSASTNWLVPNSEWWFENAWFQSVSRIGLVLCKTPDCYRIWSQKVGAQRCRLTGFRAKDYFLPEVPRLPKFLHVAGKSETKNTAAVCEAWKKWNLPYPLTVSAFKPSIKQIVQGTPNCTLVDRFPEEDMPRVMNEHQFFIMPSKYEGYGMAIHEALSCGSVVITTDAAPMKEFLGIPQRLLIRTTLKEPVRAAWFYHVDTAHLAQQVKQAAELPAESIAQLSADARAGFAQDQQHFDFAWERLMREQGF